MLLRNKLRRRDESLDRVRQEVLMAVKVSEDEINAVAGSPDLYDGLQLRIAARRTHPSAELKSGDERRASERDILNAGPALWARASLRWTLTAAAILLLAAFAALLLLPRQTSRSTQIAPVLPRAVPAPPSGVQPNGNSTSEGPERAEIVKHDPASVSQHRPSHRHQRRDSSAAEVATDFFPLTFTADSAALESGHVVRVKIARTALIAFGLPMNVARAGELITADVVIGDDGLARAIRFIQ